MQCYTYAFAFYNQQHHPVYVEKNTTNEKSIKGNENTWTTGAWIMNEWECICSSSVRTYIWWMERVRVMVFFGFENQTSPPGGIQWIWRFSLNKGKILAADKPHFHPVKPHFLGLDYKISCNFLIAYINIFTLIYILWTTTWIIPKQILLKPITKYNHIKKHYFK